MKKDNSIEILGNYIQNTLKQGYSSHQIKQALLSRNWPEEKIEDAFASLKRW